MSLTRPTGEQLLFNSSKTGEWVLDDYLENAERGTRTVAQMIADLFDTAGALRQNINQFRISATRELETRFGTFVDPNLGWVGTGAFFPRYRGTWAQGVDYKQSDYVERLGVVYLCTSDHTSTASFDTSKFITLINSPAVGALSNVTPAADTLAYFTSGTTAASTPITAYARSLLDDPDSATMRATLGFDAAYVGKTGNHTMAGFLISNTGFYSYGSAGFTTLIGGQQSSLLGDMVSLPKMQIVSNSTQSRSRISFGGLPSDFFDITTPSGGIGINKTAGPGTGTISAASVDSIGALFGATVIFSFSAPTTFSVVGAGTGNPSGLTYTPGMLMSFNGWTVRLNGTFAAGDSFTIAGVPYDARRLGVMNDGRISFGETMFSGAAVSVTNAAASGGGAAAGIAMNASFSDGGSGITTLDGFTSNPLLSPAFSGAVGTLRHFSVQAGLAAPAGGQSITTEIGFFAADMTRAATRYGFYSGVNASGGSAWAFFSAGSAPSFLAGQLGVGAFPNTFSERLVVAITGAGNTAVASFGSEVTGDINLRVGSNLRGLVRWTDALMTIGGTGATGLALQAGGATALSISTAGAVSVPGQMSVGGEIVSAFGGIRNRLINANGNVNQTGYVSGTATTAPNQYTIDMWRVVVSGQNLSWSTSGGVRTFTAPAGGVEQVIEFSNVPAGTYCLNWGGTATATVNGTAVAKGGTFVTDGNSNYTVRFINGTFSRPKVEPGSQPTPYDHVPTEIDYLLSCRYYYRVSAGSSSNERLTASGLTTASTNSQGYFRFPVRMRATPTVTVGNPTNISIYDGASLYSVTGASSDALGPEGCNLSFAHSAGGVVGRSCHITRNGTASPAPFVEFDARL